MTLEKPTSETRSQLTHWNKDAAMRANQSYDIIEIPSHLSISEGEEDRSVVGGLDVIGEPKEGDKIVIKFEENEASATDEFTYTNGTWHEKRLNYEEKK